MILVRGDRMLPGKLPAELPAKVAATVRRMSLPSHRDRVTARSNEWLPPGGGGQNQPEVTVLFADECRCGWPFVGVETLLSSM